MSRELWLRQQAIRFTYAGWSVSGICAHLARGRDWFDKWWKRYLAEDRGGLRARSPAPHTGRAAWAPEVRQAIVTIRDRLMQRHGPRERYRLAGAPTIRHELAGLGSAPVPSLRTIERVLHAAGRTAPAFRPQPCAASVAYPGPRATHSKAVHQLDLIGPRYLRGARRQGFLLVYRDSSDHAGYVEFQPKPKLDTVLAFVVHAWQRLGLPAVLQVDNRELFGRTRHPGALNRFVRLALRVGVELTFIPEHEPWRNGAIEHFNGWWQERLCALPLHSPAQVRRELAALMTTCFHEPGLMLRGVNRPQCAAVAALRASSD